MEAIKSWKYLLYFCCNFFDYLYLSWYKKKCTKREHNYCNVYCTMTTRPHPNPTELPEFSYLGSKAKKTSQSYQNAVAAVKLINDFKIGSNGSANSVHNEIWSQTWTCSQPLAASSATKQTGILQGGKLSWPSPVWKQQFGPLSRTTSTMKANYESCYEHKDVKTIYTHKILWM